MALGLRKVQGLANNEYAAAAKNFAEAEQKRIEIELQRQLFENKRKACGSRISELKAKN